MKKNVYFFVLSFVFLSVGFSQSEEVYTSGYYTFRYPQGMPGIENLAKALHSIRAEFNTYLRFDLSIDEPQCKVLIVKDKTEFDAYISSRIGTVRSQFVFLKYNNPSFSELVLYPSDSNVEYSSFAGPALNRQLFLQYLYSHIAEPPLWLRDGFQAYFEGMELELETLTVSSYGNPVWLEAAKDIYSDSSRRISFISLLSALTGSYESARYYPQAWSLASFLVQTEQVEFQRFLHETCILLMSDGNYNAESQQKNTDMILNRFVRFNDASHVDEKFALWLSNQYTFAELLQFGISLYNTGEYSAAKKRLMEANTLRENDPMLMYYLGLNSYARKEYSDARKWYKKALVAGAESATVHWALGLNEYADTKYDSARTYIEEAKKLNSVKYGEKADVLLQSIPK